MSGTKKRGPDAESPLEGRTDDLGRHGEREGSNKVVRTSQGAWIPIEDCGIDCPLQRSGFFFPETGRLPPGVVCSRGGQIEQGRGTHLVFLGQRESGIDDSQRATSDGESDSEEDWQSEILSVLEVECG